MLDTSFARAHKTELFRFRSLKKIHRQIDETAGFVPSDLGDIGPFATDDITQLISSFRPGLSHLITVDLDETLFLEVNLEYHSNTDRGMTLPEYFAYLLRSNSLDDALRFMFINFVALHHTGDTVLLDPKALQVFNDLTGQKSAKTGANLPNTIVGLTSRDASTHEQTMMQLKYTVPSLYRYFLRLNLNHHGSANQSKCIQSIIFCGQEQEKYTSLAAHCRHFDIQCAKVLSIDDSVNRTNEMASFARQYGLPATILQYSAYRKLLKKHNIPEEQSTKTAAPAIPPNAFNQVNLAKELQFCEALMEKLSSVWKQGDCLHFYAQENQIGFSIQYANGQLALIKQENLPNILLIRVERALALANDYWQIQNQLNAETEQFYQFAQHQLASIVEEDTNELISKDASQNQTQVIEDAFSSLGNSSTRELLRQYLASQASDDSGTADSNNKPSKAAPRRRRKR